jgi:hypothetical protein
VLVQLLSRRLGQVNAEDLFPDYVPGFVPELFFT